MAERFVELLRDAQGRSPDPGPRPSRACDGLPHAPSVCHSVLGRFERARPEAVARAYCQIRAQPITLRCVLVERVRDRKSCRAQASKGAGSVSDEVERVVRSRDCASILLQHCGVPFKRGARERLNESGGAAHRSTDKRLG